MKRKNESKDRLYLYIFISLIVHLLFFVVIPYGSFGVMGNNGEEHEFGFVQVVEYQANSTQNNTETSSETVTEPDSEVQPENKTKPENEPKPEPEPEPAPPEEPQEEAVVEESKDDSDDSIEEMQNESQENEMVDNSQEESVDGDNNQEEILTSEESNIEINVNEEQENESGSANGSSSESETGNESEEEPAPPPPPTAGDLLIGTPRPAYPKDLVSQSLTGEVTYKVHVGSNGKVENIETLKSSGIEQMDRTARLTIERGWEFRTYQNSYVINVTVIYEVDENGNPEVRVETDNLTFK